MARVGDGGKGFGFPLSFPHPQLEEDFGTQNDIFINAKTTDKAGKRVSCICFLQGPTDRGVAEYTDVFPEARSDICYSG